MDVCWNCGSKYDTCKALLEHLNAVKHMVLPEVTTGMPSWSDEKYFTSFLENDPLLYICEGDDDEQSEEFDIVDKDKAVRELLEFSSMNKQSIANVVEMAAKDETSVQGLGLGDSNLADVTKVFLALGDGFWHESTSPTGASVPSNKGISSSSAEIISGVVGDVPALESDVEGENSLGIKEAVVMKKDNKDKKLRVPFAKVAEREMRNANRDYFGSYSAFGIHCEMLSDRVLDVFS
jgi:protein arginine N-methyltransferase 3